MRAWSRRRIRSRGNGRRMSLSSLREAGRRLKLGLGVVDTVKSWGGSLWGSSGRRRARETEIW